MLQVIKEARDNFSKVSQQLGSRGALVDNSPFMSSLVVQIMLVFLAIGAAYGAGAGTITSMVDGINTVTKTFASLSPRIFLLSVISQFLAYFTYSNMATIVGV